MNFRRIEAIKNNSLTTKYYNTKKYYDIYAQFGFYNLEIYNYIVYSTHNFHTNNFRTLDIITPDRNILNHLGEEFIIINNGSDTQTTEYQHIVSGYGQDQ